MLVIHVSITDQHRAMALRLPGIFTFYLFVLSVSGYPLGARDWITDSLAVSEGDVECFSEYMELWIHRARIEALRQWLSGMMRIQVSLGSLEQLNQQLSACGFTLHKDPEKNYIFRVMYSGCFVQLQHGSYVIELNLLKRIHRFGGRSHNYVMRCPIVTSPPNREHIQCDPDFIQVTREIPLDSWNNELQWSLALRGNLVVALEDASLIQVNVERRQSNITIQGRRKEILRPVLVMENKGEFLPLKLVSGHYAYSMEATCPDVTMSLKGMTVLHIFKRRMGLTKRGGYENETLSVSSVVVHQTHKFTWSESSDFVQLLIPTSAIQHSRSCMGKQLLQPFFRVDVVLTFKETNHKMHWAMENTLPCMRSSSLSFREPHHSSTSSTTPLPIFPTASMFTPDIHPTTLSPYSGNNTATFAKTITPQFHPNQKHAYTTTEPNGGQHSDVKSSTTLKTSQAFSSKQQLHTGDLENIESLAAVDESTGRTPAMNQTPAGTRQTLDRTLSQQHDQQFPFLGMIHQYPQEPSAAPQTEGKSGIWETAPPVPVVTVKSKLETTHDQRVAFTEASSLEYAQKTYGPIRYASQMGETILNFMLSDNYETDKAMSPPLQTTEMFTSDQTSNNMFAHVSQPVTVSATPIHLGTVAPVAQTTDRTSTGQSTGYLPFTSHYQSSSVTHENRPTLVSSPSAFTVLGKQITERGPISPESPTAPMEQRNGTFSVPMRLLEARDQSATLSGATVQQQPAISFTPDALQTLVPSQFPTTSEKDIEATDRNTIMHSTSSTLAGNKPTFNSETHYAKERSTDRLFRQFMTPESWSQGSQLTTENPHYVNTGQTKDTKSVYTHKEISLVNHQPSPKVYTTLRAAQTTPDSKDQSSNTTTSASRVDRETPDILHQLLQAKTLYFSPTQATPASVTAHANTHEPHHRALSIPSQTEDEGLYFETAPTDPSNPTSQSETSLSVMESTAVPPRRSQPLKNAANITDKPEVGTNVPAVTGTKTVAYST